MGDRFRSEQKQLTASCGGTGLSDLLHLIRLSLDLSTQPPSSGRSGAAQRTPVFVEKPERFLNGMIPVPMTFRSKQLAGCGSIAWSSVEYEMHRFMAFHSDMTRGSLSLEGKTEQRHRSFGPPRSFHELPTPLHHSRTRLPTRGSSGGTSQLRYPVPIVPYPAGR
jgi:hypothetical protein